MNIHPLSAGSFTNLLGLLFRYGVDPQNIGRAMGTLSLSASSAPARAAGRTFYKKALSSINICPRPIFIIGHWRSGTTLLHDILSQDPQFGFISMSHALAPEVCVEQRPLLKKVLEKNLPETRPQDNVTWTPHTPQEEDVALSGFCEHAFLHGFYFPRHAQNIFDRYVLFREKGKNSIHLESKWAKNYISVLKRASFEFNERPLLLKNPPNTARIPLLITLFPEARFIHIYRNPYEIFFSTKNLYQKMGKYSFRNSSERRLEEDIFSIYKKMFEKYFFDQSMVSPENLIEISYRELIENPMNMVHLIYEKLDIEGLSSAKTSIQRYVQSQRKYKRNSYSMEPEVIDKIYENWHPTIDRWGYAPPT